MNAPAPRPRPRLIEVGPRDGLHNEKRVVPLDAKVAFIDALSDAGLADIEAAAFLDPKASPALADSQQVFARITRKPGVSYAALVAGEPGLELALALKATKILVAVDASETHAQKIGRASVAETLARLKPVLARARAARLPARAVVSYAFWCPYEGLITPAKVADLARRLEDLGATEWSIGDTLGKASPDEVRRLLGVLLKAVAPASVSLHFHNTFGRAVANALVAWKTFGVSRFEASAGGAGGCPWAPRAAGNASTESLLSAFKAAGADTGVDETKLKAASAALFAHLGRPPGTRPS
ncbi:MAG: hydroxymethylglutaryl-CoA lyase [Elusimicrobiota bacterium]|nr:hydroxymethylglutaryl-CoA lyase [Elusimicrobiota bacterium]